MDFLQGGSNEKKKPEESTHQSGESSTPEKIDKGMFTRNEVPSGKLTAPATTRKNLIREERKSFEERHEMLQKNMTQLNKITSPSLGMRPPILACPELVLDGSATDTPKQAENATFVIAIIGGANSGKTLLVDQFVKEYRKLGKTVSVLKEKNFTKPINIENQDDRANFMRDYDFDAPIALDWASLELGIKMLVDKKPFNTPVYNIFSQKRLEGTDKVNPAEFLILEGRLLLHMEQIRRYINFSIYLDTDLDILLSRRIYKSMSMPNAIPLDEVIRRYQKFVKPNQEKFVEPSKSKANVTLTNYRGVKFGREGLTPDDKDEPEVDENILLIKMLARANIQEHAAPHIIEQLRKNSYQDEFSPAKEKPHNPLFT